MSEVTRADAEIVSRLRNEAGASRAIDALAWEIRQGDAHGRQRAEHDLKAYATGREIAAIKRHLKC